jgi:hypothetical protein
MHSSIDEHVGWFLNLAIVKNTTVNMEERRGSLPADRGKERKKIREKEREKEVKTDHWAWWYTPIIPTVRRWTTCLRTAGAA